jgi:transcriptional regulator with XRE-family HTH domain
VLRLAIGLTQKEMAALVNRSPVTIQKVELGQLHLGEELGQEIASATGVSLEWLLENDVSKPAVNDDGAPYTREDFEEAQSENPRSTEDTFERLIDATMGFPLMIALISRGLLAAHRVGKGKLARYRLMNAIMKATADFKGFNEIAEDLQIALRNYPASFKGDVSPKDLVFASMNLISPILQKHYVETAKTSNRHFTALPKKKTSAVPAGSIKARSKKGK